MLPSHIFQVSLGVAIPVGSLIWRIHLPAVGGSLISLTTTLAFLFDFPIRDIARYTMPALDVSMAYFASLWNHPLSSEWMRIWAITPGGSSTRDVCRR